MNFLFTERRRIRMMNILFVTADNVNPLSGGIARMTYLLASELGKRGCICTSAYLQAKQPTVSNEGVFADEFHLQEGDNSLQVSSIISTNNIDFVIAQGVDALMNRQVVYLRKGIELLQKRPFLLFVFHQMPGYELHSMDTGVLIDKLFSKDRKKPFKQLLMQTLMKLNKSAMRNKLHKKYSIPYQMADKVILLSPAYIPDFELFAKGKDLAKYAAIPNMLTFSSVDALQGEKNNEVLMVSRMDEDSKRIKIALLIWSKLSQDLLDQGWKLTIVGDGEDLPYYRQYVRKNHIANVQFEGQQNPLPYYRRSSVFMLTSAFEGWPMTLMEAMQNGCVPIVFDTFKAARDIIESGKDGVIVPEGKSDEYAIQLTQLMRDSARREKMAQAGLTSCQRFSKECITDRWMDLFNRLQN